MPSTCAVAICRNRSDKTKNIIYHQFPKHPDIKKLWINACKRADSGFNVQNARICSEHFQLSDYVRDLKAELLGYVPTKKVLQECAVPTQNLSEIIDSSKKENTPISESNASFVCSTDFSRESRLQKRNVRKRALETFENISPVKKIADASTNTVSSDYFNVKKLHLELKTIKRQLQIMKAKFKKLKKENAALKNNSQCKGTAIKQICSPVLSDAQMNYLMQNKKKGRWSQDDIGKALTFRSISKRAYQYKRKTGEPLPGLSTLQRWTKSFTCEPGLMNKVLDLMKTKGDIMKANNRYTVLMFDEMNIDSRLCYDQKEDKILGPHKNVQVIMARSLMNDWKQPIYYDFDVSINKKVLTNVICSLEEINYQIIGIVSDMGPRNLSLWKELNISHENTAFKNPYDESRNVWVFADVPHLIKLLRNHVLDSGLSLGTGKLIDKNVFIKLLEKDNSEIKLCPHLTNSHINIIGRDRQNVRMAAQLFSGRTATAIEFVLKDKEVADFIHLVNDSFDILNSRIPIDFKKEISSGFGMFFEKQNEILNNFQNEIIKMRVGKNKNLIPFQKGFVITIKSLKGLFHDMNMRGLNYILTSRLNQDCLENFFSQLRGLGYFYNNPSPTEVKNRLRLLLLCKNASKILQSSALNVQKEDNNVNEAYITSEICLGLTDMNECRNVLDDDAEERNFVQNNNIDVNNMCIDNSDANNTTVNKINVNNHTNCANVKNNDIVNYVNNYSKNSCEGNVCLYENSKKLVENDTESENKELLLKTSSADCPSEGLRYIAGYIAKKCCKFDNSLGEQSRQLPIVTSSFGWIEMLSRGGLVVPSNKWHDEIKEMEKMFIKIHGNSLLKEKIIENTCMKIESNFPNIHKNVIKTFVKTRVFIRLRHINEIYTAEIRKRYAARKSKMWSKSILIHK